MVPLADVPVVSAPPRGGGAHGLLRWMSTNNPFYVLSAGFFLAGLWISFGGKTQTEETWALMSGLAGYTLLLAVTAFVLVRFCNIWDDVRTVLLLVVLMFLAMSVTFDELLVEEQETGIACYLGGLLFAVAVTETLLRGIRLRLPALYRVPYYLLLGLFFLYPIALSTLVHGPRSETLLWALFGFAPAAALIFLTLLPAVRRGPSYVQANGSPWRWPLYPWVLFGVFAVAVAGRAWFLCVSMDLLNMGLRGQLIFGPYFLVPLGLAGIVILLEMGIISKNHQTMVAALVAPLLLLVLCVVGHRPEDRIYQGFLALVRLRLGGGPVFVTLALTAGFYAYALVRRVPRASEGLTVALAGLAVIRSEVLMPGEPVTLSTVALLAIALLQLALGLRQRSSWRCLLGAAALVAGWTLALGDGTPRTTLLAGHLMWLAVLMIGAAFADLLATRLRLLAAGLGVWACVMGLFVPEDFLKLPSWLLEAYAPTMAALVAAYGLLLVWRPALVMGGVSLVAWLASFGLRGYGSLRQAVHGLDYLAVSLTLFAMALGISVLKSGVVPRQILTRMWKNEPLRPDTNGEPRA
jgi:hypothetical protein